MSKRIMQFNLYDYKATLEWFHSFFNSHHIHATSITTKATSPFKTAPINPRSVLSDTGALRL